MTNTKTQIEYFHNHILLIPAYKTPDIHSHLASHLIIAINGNLKCVIENESIETKMICIASDVWHTAYMDQGQMVTFLIDETSNYSKTLEKLYLKGSKYSIINDELMYRKICDVWNNNKNDLKKAYFNIEDNGITNNGLLSKKVKIDKNDIISDINQNKLYIKIPVVIKDIPNKNVYIEYLGGIKDLAGNISTPVIDDTNIYNNITFNVYSKD